MRIIFAHILESAHYFEDILIMWQAAVNGNIQIPFLDMFNGN